MSETGPFSQATQDWFSDSFDGPTPVQDRGWEAVCRGAHTLLVAPTGRTAPARRVTTR